MAGSFVTSDLSAVFSTADFAVLAVINGVHQVKGIFEDETVETDVASNRVVHTIEVSFTCRTCDPIAEGDSVQVAGVNYTARSPMQDGTGVTVWSLVRV